MTTQILNTEFPDEHDSSNLSDSIKPSSVATHPEKPMSINTFNCRKSVAKRKSKKSKRNSKKQHQSQLGVIQEDVEGYDKSHGNEIKPYEIYEEVIEGLTELVAWRKMQIDDDDTTVIDCTYNLAHNCIAGNYELLVDHIQVAQKRLKEIKSFIDIK